MFKQVARPLPDTATVRRKLPPWLADVVTLSSLACAVVAMTATLHENFLLASAAVLLAVYTDGLDGCLARMSGRCSEVGEQLDSLADVVVFGAAPALIVYAFYLQQFPATGTLVATAFVLAAAFRLAHFHPDPSLPYFSGLPTTATGATVALLPFVGTQFPPLAIAIVVLSLGYLMLTTWRFPKAGLLLSQIPVPGRVMLGAIVPVLFIIHPELLLLLPALYIAGSLVWNVQLAARAEPGAL